MDDIELGLMVLNEYIKCAEAAYTKANKENDKKEMFLCEIRIEAAESIMRVFKRMDNFLNGTINEEDDVMSEEEEKRLDIFKKYFNKSKD
jgi:hypothetical protein